MLVMKYVLLPLFIHYNINIIRIIVNKMNERWTIGGKMSNIELSSGIYHI